VIAAKACRELRGILAGDIEDVEPMLRTSGSERKFRSGVSGEGEEKPKINVILAVADQAAT
jgi:hypothetical protein